MTYPDWLLKPHGTSAAYRRHRRHGEEACQACKQAEALRQQGTRPSRWSAVHLAVSNGKPRCGNRTPHAIAEPGQDITCGRCITLAGAA